jgi:hypothetical protein
MPPTSSGRVDAYCGHCGEAVTGHHDACRRALEMEPPRYCTECRRRMVVQVTPTGWTARCSRHGSVTSASLDRMTEGPDGSVLGNLGPATWSAEEGVAYEVALEGINHVIGAYAAMIGKAESAPEPDLDAIARWRHEQQKWSVRRRELSPGDFDAVQQVREECAALLAEFRDRG